jgi:hypothetical protein
MLIGAIAISGIPPLAGFFSKDEILGESYMLGFSVGLGDRSVVATHDARSTCSGLIGADDSGALSAVRRIVRTGSTSRRR